MNAITQTRSYFDLLIPSDDKEVIRKFNQIYVENEVTKFKALGINDHDIINYFHKAQKSGADPVMGEIFLIPNKVFAGKENGRDVYKTVGTTIFSYHYLEKKAKQIIQDKEKKTVLPEAEVEQGDYFDPEVGEFRKTLKAVATIKIGDVTYKYTAWYPEYVQLDYTTKKPKSNWKKPHIMLRKCSIMGLLRSVFPEALSGYYSQEEVGAYEDDEAIEAEVIREAITEKKTEKLKEAVERIEHKEEKKENADQVNSIKDSIKTNLGSLTKGKTPAEKGAIMLEILGIRSWKDIDTLSLPQLIEKRDLLIQKIFEQKNEDIQNLMTTYKSDDNPPPPSDSDMPNIEDETFVETVVNVPIEGEVLPAEDAPKKTTTKKTTSSKPTFKL